MFKETLLQSAADGTSFVDCLVRQGVLPGIKVDEVLPPCRKMYCQEPNLMRVLPTCKSDQAELCLLFFHIGNACVLVEAEKQAHLHAFSAACMHCRSCFHELV